MIYGQIAKLVINARRMCTSITVPSLCVSVRCIQGLQGLYYKLNIAAGFVLLSQDF